MIDISKINVGDEVTVKAKVIQIDRKHTAEPVRLNGGSWVLGKDIIAHHPKPREFKPGDRVTAGGSHPLVLVAMDGSEAWVKTPTGNFTVDVSDLLHADESPVRDNPQWTEE